MSIHEDFLTPYDAKTAESEVITRWNEANLASPEACIDSGVTKPDAETFSMVLPPPNVTGTLHMGHAMMLAVQDILVRFERMRGKRTLWIPGTDHAAIATQSKVESILYKKEGKTRHDLGREEFLKKVEQFAQESHDTIVNQVRRMGASVDWSREAYTLDEARSKAVRTAFVKMYTDELIYRGARLVNWDPKLQTTVSDDEIDWLEEKTPLYYLKYGPFTIATSRPETKFGDKYVVMHPDDARYLAWNHGDKIELEWINGPVTATVIKDSIIDPAFGTGVMTITPWHDATDYDLAERHGLPKEQVIDFRGLLLPIAGAFAGQHIKKARPLIVEHLTKKGLIEKIDETYIHRIATNSRGGGTIEPQIKEQWFVDVNKPIKDRENKSLKELMREAVASGETKLVPDRFDKVYFHWIDNLRDWCISRQIWYGHRVPVWYKETEMHVGVEAPTGDGWTQDPDTLDTWFSSGLWTFSTLGWPDEKSSDLKTYHPTALLETGYDILFFWVARMVLFSTYILGEVPFKTVYLHGLVRDAKGRKMSKSLDNIIDPVEMIEKYGADATRMSLIIGATPGADIKLSEDKVRGYKHFGNKLWNITRFVLTTTKETDEVAPKSLAPDVTERWEAFVLLAKEITEDIREYRLYLAGEKLYHYAWHTFADEIIEWSKGEAARDDVRYLLRAIWKHLLIMLHPFMPFVTEAIWIRSYPNNTLLMGTPWPNF